MRCVLYFDGGCQPKNPGGVATYGAVLYDADTKKVITKIKGVAAHGEHATNNVAEYSALIFGLREAQNRKVEKILIRGDSQLVIKQVTGEYACNKEHLQKQKEAVLWLLKSFPFYKLEWIPREKNSVADQLSNEAYEEYCKEHNLPVKYFKKPG